MSDQGHGTSCQTLTKAARLAALAAVTATALIACVQSNFYGDTHAPTNQAELFDRFEDIEHPHETIGRLVTIERMASQPALINAMRREAARRGADAMVITSIEQFAWSDGPGGGDLIDPELDPIGAAIDSKRRWRGEAVLLRWTDRAEARGESPSR